MKSFVQYINENNINENETGNKSELWRKLAAVLQKAKKLEGGMNGGFNGYYHRPDDMKKLNPAFGYKASDADNGLSSKGVGSIWMRDYDNPDRLTVRIQHYGHKDNGKEYTPENMTDEQMEAVIKFVEEKVKEMEDLRAEGAKNPKVDDIIPDILDVCEKYIKDHNKESKYRIFKAKGKRTKDNESGEYNAIVIDKKYSSSNEPYEQMASIAILQDKYGVLGARLQVVMGGDYDPIIFTPENIKETFNNLMKRIVGA